MAHKNTRSRICDQCGAEKCYEPDECDEYKNRFGKWCMSAPMDDMIVVSVPFDGRRLYYDFCSANCLKEWVNENAK